MPTSSTARASIEKAAVGIYDKNEAGLNKLDRKAAAPLWPQLAYCSRHDYSEGLRATRELAPVPSWLQEQEGADGAPLCSALQLAPVRCSSSHTPQTNIRSTNQ